MKRYIIPVLTVIVLVSLVLGGCAKPAAAPAPTPEAEPAAYQALKDAGLVRADLPLNPYAGGLATKPDGTPYKIGQTWILMEIDVIVNLSGLMDSYMRRAGGEYVTHNAEFNADLQIAWLEDQTTVPTVDAVMLHAVDEKMVVPAAEALQASGTPVLSWDCVTRSDNLFGHVGHDYAGPLGDNSLGEYLVKYVEKTGEELYVLTPWSSYSTEMFLLRHQGFEMGVANNTKIHLVDPQIETGSGDAATQDVVMDWFTTHPELNAMFMDGGGGTGGIEGLRAIDRLKPIGDPDHVVAVFNDNDTLTVEMMREGLLDATTSHPTLDYADLPIKVLLNWLVLGEPMPAYKVHPPMLAIGADELDTAQLFGCTALYPNLPQGKWDIWPVLDLTEPGLLSGAPEYRPVTIETPTVEKRKAKMGY